MTTLYIFVRNSGLCKFGSRICYSNDRLYSFSCRIQRDVYLLAIFSFKKIVDRVLMNYEDSVQSYFSVEIQRSKKVDVERITKITYELFSSSVRSFTLNIYTGVK